MDFDDIYPKGKCKLLAQFNKESKILLNVIGYVDPDTLNNDYYLYRKVELDIDNEEIIGNYDNYKVVPKSTQPVIVKESMLDIMCRAKIEKEYHTQVQLDIFRRVVAELIEKSGIKSEAIDLFNEMNDYISECKRANKVMKESYKKRSDFTYITRKEEFEENEKKYAGGLHEHLGTRETTWDGEDVTVKLPGFE